MTNFGVRGATMVQNTDVLGIKQFFGLSEPSDPAFPAAWEYENVDGSERHQEVMDSIKSFMVDRLERGGRSVEGYQFGTWESMKNTTAAVLYMMRKRVGTPFAVWGCVRDTLKSNGAYWNYAIRTETGVTFFDCPDRTSEDAAIASSTSFIPPRSARDDSDAYDGLVVLSFPEKVAA